MKKIIESGILILLFSIVGISTAYGQNDILLKTNGNEMVGKVIAVNDNDLKFVYQNETVEYTVPTKDIAKVTFSSGRIQFFNTADSKSSASTADNVENHHNKVAILPFGYIRDQEEGSAGMTEKIQREAYSIFKNKSVNLQFQDINTTNNLLAKAGVSDNNKNGYGMGEICNILGVEYVIQGTVSVEKTNVTNVSSTSVKGKSDTKATTDNIIGNLWGTSKSSASATTVGTTVQNYATTININIYNDKGDNIFSQDHDSFWQSEDSYKITLNFLAKKSPLYKR